MTATLTKFRKKPVIIEAVQLQQRFHWPEWFHDAVSANKVITYGIGKMASGPVYAEIHTLEGVMTASEGDWIIRGIKGELYPCKPDIFAMTYESASGDLVSVPALPSGWRLELIGYYKNSANRDLYICDIINKESGRLVSTNCYPSPTEALTAAIDAAMQART